MKKRMILCLVCLMMFSLVACGTPEESGNNAATVSVAPAQLYTLLKEKVTQPEMLELDAALMLDYCGIREADVQQAVVAICADSLRTDEIWILKASDEVAANKLIDLAKNRLKKKGEESITYSPEQYAVVEKAQILQNGNYVILLVSPSVADMAAAVNTITGVTFQKVN